MKTKPLGRTGQTVPQICLGTMTWGSRNTEAEGHAQMDLALDHGVSFIDTAEMYPTYPVSAETQGRTEEIVGSWMAARGTRDRVTLATKVAGQGISWVRDGAGISAEGIAQAVDGSLRRLRTDMIDLYQLHWPNRGHYHFRKQWEYDPSGQDSAETLQHISDVLGELGRQVDAGKIRSIGLSNETAWGTQTFLQIAQAEGLPRVATIQNEYSLMYRTYDLDLAELSHHEDVGLLAYTPLAGGLLSGKYSGGAIPDGARGSIDDTIGGRRTPRSLEVADKYVALARDHGLDPAQMAIAFCLTRPFMASVIIGATDLDQLEAVLGAANVVLSDEVMAGISQIHRDHPSPY